MKKIKSKQVLPVDAMYDEMSSPVGTLTIIASIAGLHAILWSNLDREKILLSLRQSNTEKIIAQTKNQLTEYFQGTRKTFDLPLAMQGTDFQRAVWNELINIPYGTTISYAEQAKRIGDKNKARAVGMANGLNPIPIVIPCHRVIGSQGKLVGFAGGLDKKSFLLNLEKTY
jgi:methylated-DNA-[protein]-cysteine S-methyltransferase